MGGGSRLRLSPPVSPTPDWRFPIDTVAGGWAVSLRSRLTLPEIRSLSPDTVSVAIATYCPPPRKGAGGGRGSGRVVGVFWRRTFNQRRRRHGRGEPSPPPPSPSAPPPRGDIPSTQFQGRDPLSAVSVNTLLKSCLCPRALYPDYRHALPAPSEGGGRRRGTRRAVGVVYLTRKKSVWLRHRRQGRRMFHPPPRRPLPQGGDIPSIQCPGESTPSPGSR